MLVFFLVAGRVTDLGEEFGALEIAGTVLIVVGVVALAFVEQRLSRSERDLAPEERK